jgi:hypothetical protein
VCFGTRGVVLFMSGVSRELRMLTVCYIREEKRMEVKAGRMDTYTGVPVI